MRNVLIWWSIASVLLILLLLFFVIFCYLEMSILWSVNSFCVFVIVIVIEKCLDLVVNSEYLLLCLLLLLLFKHVYFVVNSE